MVPFTLFTLTLFTAVFSAEIEEVENPCDREYVFNNCRIRNVSVRTLVTVEDYDNCAPTLLSPNARNYFMAGAGREVTLRENRDAFASISIVPRILQDVSESQLSVTVLGKSISFPVGVSPVAVQKLAHPEGEIGTAKAAALIGTVMVLSSAATTLLEDVMRAARSATVFEPVLWMQTYLLANREETIQLVRRAEKAGFSAIVVTVDTQLEAELNCQARSYMVQSMNVSFPNMFNGTFETEKIDASVTFKDLAWLSGNTYLPIVAKGVLSGADAVRAVLSGAAAIFVSNHGGRQMDGAPATIDVLPGIVDALRHRFPKVEVYVDGGIRNGFDVYKALARGARVAFVGRPSVWGLTVGGEEGVYDVLSILRREFNETMLVAGVTHPSFIRRSSIIPDKPGYGCL